MNEVLALILCSVLLNSTAQLLLKAGMNHIGHISISYTHFAPTLLKIASNPHIIGGLSLYVASVLVWLIVLSRAEISFAYPMISIGYIITALAGYGLFNETLSPVRIAGIMVIIIGVYLITRS